MNKFIVLFARDGNIGETVRAFNTLWSLGMEPDEWSYRALLIAYADLGDVDTCKSLIEKLPNAQRDDRVIAQMVQCYYQAGRYEDVFSLLPTLKRKEYRKRCYAIALEVCVATKDVQKAEEIIKVMKDDRVAMNSRVASTPLRTYIQRPRTLTHISLTDHRITDDDRFCYCLRFAVAYLNVLSIANDPRYKNAVSELEQKLPGRSDVFATHLLRHCMRQSPPDFAWGKTIFYQQMNSKALDPLFTLSRALTHL